MTLTAGQLLDAIRQRIGGPVSPELGGSLRAINRAGEWLDGVHSWQQRLRVNAQLDFTAGDTFLTLPANVRTIVAEEQPGISGFGRSVCWVSTDQMQNLRSQGSIAAGGFALYVSIESTGTDWRLGLYQTPDVDTADVIRISYLAGWVKLVGNTDQVMIHASLEPLLEHVVREYAAGLEGYDLDTRLGAILGGPLFMQARLADAKINRQLGPMQGGAVAMAAGFNGDWNDWMRGPDVQVLPS